MIHKSCSIQEVIGRIIRNTRIQDSSYITDMYEWIPEAMDLMRTKMELTYSYKDVEVDFHKGKMPCGLIHIMAVEYYGMRLKYGNTPKHYKTEPVIDKTISNVDLFTSVVKTQDIPNGNYIWTSDIKSVNNLKQSIDIYYQIEMDYINTSFCDGMIRLHYLSQPMDCDGFPLIPDNGNYKEALYYYVRSKMIGCGYKDTAFNEQELMQRFELYASRAMAQIRYPSVDVVHERIAKLTKYVLPENYWEHYFNGINN